MKCKLALTLKCKLAYMYMAIHALAVEVWSHFGLWVIIYPIKKAPIHGTACIAMATEKDINI